MRTFLKLIFTTLICCFSLSVNSQQLELKPLAPLGEETSNNVSKIVQDGQGFIWIIVHQVGLFRFDGYEFKKYPLDSGINDFFVDQENDFWVGGSEGLYYYQMAADSFELKTFPVPEEKKMMDNHINYNVSSLSGDQFGNIWFGTNGGGIIRMDKKTGAFKQFYYDEVSGNQLFWQNLIRRIHVDQKGRIWGDSQGGALLHLDPETEELKMIKFEEQDIRSWRTNDIYEDQTGMLWVCTFNGIYKLNPNTFETEHFPLIGERCNYIHRAKDGKFWIGTHQGLVIFDPKSKKHETYPIARNSTGVDWVSQIYEDKRGDYWISTMGDKGLYFLDQTTPQVKQIKHPALPTINPRDPYKISPIYVIYEDSDSILWVGGKQTLSPDYSNPALLSINQKGNEVNKYYKGEDAYSVSDEHVSTIFEDHKGIIWIGTAGLVGGLNRLDKATGKIEHYFPFQDPKNYREITQNCIEKIFEDSQHRLWLIWNGGGLHRFDPQTKSFVYYKQTLTDSLLAAQYLPEINMVAHDAWGRYGFFSKDSVHLSGNKIFDINEDDNGHLWLGTSLGLSKVNIKNNTYSHEWPAKDSIEDKRLNIYALAKDTENKFWIANEKNIASFSPESKTVEIVKEGIRQFKIPTIDRNGKVWFWYFDSSQKIELFSYDPDTKKLEHFGKKNGMLGEKRINSSYTFNPSSSGNLHASFKNVNGINYFDPSTFSEPNFSPPVVFTSFARYNSKEELGTPIIDSLITVRDSVTLTHKDNILRFKFAALNYNTSEKNQYAYLLEGLNEGWIELGTSRELTLTNLDHGDYTLRIKGTNEYGRWSEQEAELHLRILPPWWKTKLAYLIYFLIGAGILYAIFSFLKKRWQLQNELKLEKAEADRIKELDAFKSTFYTNITHEFRTPLTVILGMAQQIKEKPQQFLEEGITLIERNGKNLLKQINQILDLSKLETNTLQLNLVQSDVIEFLRYSTEAFQSFANGKNLSLRFFSPVESLQMDYDPDSLQNVMSNLLSNALKFTPEGGDVKTALSINHNQLIIKIIDTGIGIKEKDLTHVFDRFYQAENTTTKEQYGTGVGLAYTKALVQLMDGIIEVESKFGKGTTFLVKLPIALSGELEMKKEDWVESKLSEITSINGTQSPSSEKDSILIPQPSGPQSSELPQLLLIEDNADVVTYLKSCLQDQYQIQVAYNGRIGIEKAIENTPDLIISDVMMPEKDGFEVCDTLKQDVRTSHIPIILLTAKADLPSKIVGLRRGADAYLAKPFDKEELLVRLEMMVEKQQKLAAFFSKNGESNIGVEELEEAVKVEHEFIQKIRKIVEQHYANDQFGLPQLCQKAGMSRSQLYRKMKALIDTSPSDFIRSYRLQQAKHLLKTTDLNVSEVAWDTGFTNLTHFAKVFQEEFGVLPSKLKTNDL